ETNSGTIDGQRDFADLPMADAPLGAVLPHQKSEKRSRCASAISVEQAELLGILESTSPLDDAQAQKANVEIDISLHCSGNEGDVVDSACHGGYSLISEFIPEIEKMRRRAYGLAPLRSVNASTATQSNVEFKKKTA